MNDLLTVITGRAERLLDRVETDAAARESLTEIYAAGERAASLVRQLSWFGGRETIHARLLDLNALVGETRATLNRLMSARISLAFQLEAGLPLIAADARMMEEVLLGLAFNACDAMPQGGRLLVSTSAVTLDEADVQPATEGRPGQFVVLRVADCGGGIPPAILPRIFEPFFTTNPTRRAGLGLAAVFGIVQQHHGWVAVASAVGAGTTFTVYLPALPDGTYAETSVPASGSAGSGQQAILLVEDDPAVREFTAAVLRDCGYRVLQAGSATDALEVWKWHGARIELLLTDVVLEGQVSGLELARKLRADRPALRVICSSGYAGEISGQAAALEGGCHFLSKPCRPQALARAVRVALQSKPS